MSTTLPRLDEPGDAELISAVRAGDVAAYGELFRRHVDAARRLARQLVSTGDADDLVSDAFAKVLTVLQRGGGPDLAFRAYLLTALRRLHVDRIRAGARLHTTDDLTPFDPGVPFRDTAVEGFESATAARAFASLPERWQTVLWHTEVEGQKPADVAPLLGMSPNSVSALAYRAREGLRQAFLAQHAQDAEDDECTRTRAQLGAYVRNGLSRRDAAKVEDHVEDCRCCAAVYLELVEVNGNLAGLLAPLLLGGLATAYVGSAATATATGAAAVGQGGLLVLLGRARDAMAAHLPATAAAGVAATVAIGGAVWVGVDRGPAVPEAGRATVTEAAPVDARPGSDARDRSRKAAPDPRPAGERTAADPAPLPAPSAAPPAQAPTGPSAPGPSPEPQPDPQPEPQPEPEPEPQPEPEPEADLRVTATARAQGPLTWQVVVHVVGAGDGARLTVTGTGSVVLTTDGRCAGLAVGSGTCAVTSAPYSFTAVAPLGGSLTFTVADGPGGDAGDDRATVHLE